MHHASVQLGPLLFATVLVMGAVFTGIVLGVRALNRRVARLEAEAAVAGSPVAPPGTPYRASAADPSARPAPGADLVPVAYVLAILFWPAAFGLGAYLLRDARTARAGRTCMLIGMGILGTVSALTCAGMVAGALAFQRAEHRSEEARRLAATPRATTTPTPRPPPRPSPISEPAVATGRLGEEVTVGDLTVQVHAVDRLFVPTSTARQTPGSRWIAFDVSFRNDGTKPVSIGTHQVRLYDADGFAATSKVAYGKEPRLSYATLTPGNVVRGWVTFELRDAAKPGRLQITTSGGGAPRIAEVRIDD